MGEYTKSELLTLLLIVENVDRSVESIQYDKGESDKLAYSSCLNDNEKTQYTKQEIKKLQKDFQNCDSSIAPYITAFIREDPHETLSFDELKSQIISNYISSEFGDLIISISESESFEEDDEIEFRDYT